MSTFFIQTSSYNGLQWQKNIYSTIVLDDPVTNLDCMNQCLNVQSTICQFFILQNNNCYMGRTDITNGTMAQTNTTVTVYTLISKTIIRWKSNNLLIFIFPTLLRIVGFFFKHIKIQLSLLILIILATLGKFFVTRAGVAGSKWSKYIYMSLPSISKNQCEGLCLLTRYSNQQKNSYFNKEIVIARLLNILCI